MSPQRKTIAIIGGADSLNIGDEAIFLGMVTRINAAIPQCRIVAIVRYPTRVQRYCPVETVRRSNLLGMVRLLWRLDVLVVGGGGILQDYTSLSNLAYYLFFLSVAMIFKKKTMCYAVGAGPLHRTISRWLIKVIVGRVTSVTVRDEYSRELLIRCRLPLKNIHVVADPACALIPEQVHRLPADLNGLSLPPNGEVVGISLRPWFFALGGVMPLKRKLNNARWFGPYESFLMVMARTIDRFIERYQVKFLFLPFEYEHDRKIFLELLGRVRHRESLYCLDRQLTPLEMLGTFTTLSMTLAMRFHSQLFSLMNNIPFVSLLYSKKSEGIATAAGLRAYALSVESCTEGQLLTAMENVWTNRAALAVAVQAASERARTNETSAQYLRALLFDELA